MSEHKSGFNLRAVARAQRNLNLAILGTLLLVALLALVDGATDGSASLATLVTGALGLCYYGIQLFALVSIFMLTRALHGVGIALVLAVLMLVPCVNLLTLLWVNRQATNVLKKAGVHVGILGANPASVPDDGRQLSEVIATFR